jgi:hypothetical protein
MADCSTGIFLPGQYTAPAMPAMKKAPSAAEIEARLRELTLLMYDTSVPLATLEERVYPSLSPSIAFIDPWIVARGARKFEVGLRGFHCAIRFDFDIFQLGVQLNERGDGGRAIVDGVMNLRQLRVYTYPLRTILVIDFVITEETPILRITRLEEMWSYGDMIANLPLLGRIYDVSRFFGGYFFTGLFWLACVLRRGEAQPRPRSPSSR